MEYSLKKLSKTFDQKLTKSIQKIIRIGFVNLSSIPARGIETIDYTGCLRCFAPNSPPNYKNYIKYRHRFDKKPLELL